MQAWAHGGTASVYRITGHDCADGATDPFDQVGHFTANLSGNTVSGTVELDTVAPNAHYMITLVQNHPCTNMVVGTVTTDSHGFRTLSFTALASRGVYEVFVVTSHNGHQLASSTVPVRT
jgi:hypothetical protein